MNYDDIEWHDGIFEGIDISPDLSSVTFRVKLASALLSRDHKPYLIRIEQPSRLTINLDLVSLKDNARSGNVTGGKVISGTEPKLILVLAEGYIEAQGSKISVAPQ